MIITIESIRIKGVDEIKEIFKVNPFIRFVNDDDRVLGGKIRMARNYLALSKEIDVKLKNIIYNKDVIYIYSYSDENFDTHKYVTFNYFPVLGKKQCKNCTHFLKEYDMCYIRRNLTKGCLFWYEKETR